MTFTPAKEPKGSQKGSVALLQEFVQCARHFAMPQHRAILQWSFDQRMSGSTSLEFRATVAFLLDGVPHHVAGGWLASKKLAQRDVAERALCFFVGRWGEQLLLEDASWLPPAASAAPAGASPPQVLELFCASHKACGGRAPRWSHRFNGDDYSAEVEILLLGVPHKFAGEGRPSKAEAFADVARRVLWYFQHPGYERTFVPDQRSEAVSGKEIPAPPTNWACSGGEVEELRKAERKTVLMRVQNKLQQELAKTLKPGQSVWEWSYEMDDEDTVWPPLYRATVVVPGLRKSFVGDWARGQREAQLEASLRVAAYLDGGGLNAASVCSGSSFGSEDGERAARRWADIEVEREA